MVAPAPASVPPTSREPAPAAPEALTRPRSTAAARERPRRLAPPPPRLRPGLRPGPSPAPRGLPAGAVAAWVCLVLGLAAVAWLPASLWPRAGLPAWPAVSLGLVAVLVSWGRGGAGLRALGGIAGLVAALVGTAQIAALWMAAWGLSYM